MKNLPEKLISFCLMLPAGNACFGVGLESESKKSFQPSVWVAVSDEHLDNMRGGFDVGAGLNVSFGIVRTISINGDIVNSTRFNLPDVSRITTEQAQIASAAMAEAGIVQNGANNFVAAGVASQLNAGTVIQNSLNDQKIQTLTVINASVNSLGILKAINTQNTLREAILGSMGIR